MRFSVVRGFDVPAFAAPSVFFAAPSVFFAAHRAF
jgi:hypothetical protein